MCLTPAAGLFFIVPTSVILTISFFVIFVNSRVQNKSLKVYGWAVAGLLWVSAGILLGSGIFNTFSSGNDNFGCVRDLKCGMAEDEMMEMEMADPHHGMKIDPHHGMMKYHQYDAEGNVILEKSAAPGKKEVQ